VAPTKEREIRDINQEIVDTNNSNNEDYDDMSDTTSKI